jgi:hypothetical protein
VAHQVLLNLGISMLMIIEGVGQGRLQLLDIGQNTTRMPMREIGISFPIELVRIEEDARAPVDHELVCLAACIANIDIRPVEIFHRGERAAVHVDEYVRSVGKPLWNFADPSNAGRLDRDRDAPFKQHYVRRKDQLVFGMSGKPLEDLGAETVPG